MPQDPASRKSGDSSVVLLNGDNVGVVTAWEYPTAAAAAVDLPDVVCAQIHAEVAKGTYKAAVQSPDWVGNLIARLLHIDRNTKPGKTAVERYRQGRIIPPVNATTSSVAYQAAAQQAGATQNATQSAPSTAARTPNVAGYGKP